MEMDKMIGSAKRSLVTLKGAIADVKGKPKLRMELIVRLAMLPTAQLEFMLKITDDKQCVRFLKEALVFWDYTEQMCFRHIQLTALKMTFQEHESETPLTEDEETELKVLEATYNRNVEVNSTFMSHILDGIGKKDKNVDSRKRKTSSRRN